MTRNTATATSSTRMRAPAPVASQRNARLAPPSEAAAPRLRRRGPESSGPLGAVEPGTGRLWVVDTNAPSVVGGTFAGGRPGSPPGRTDHRLLDAVRRP